VSNEDGNKDAVFSGDMWVLSRIFIRNLINIVKWLQEREVHI